MWHICGTIISLEDVPFVYSSWTGVQGRCNAKSQNRIQYDSEKDEFHDQRGVCTLDKDFHVAEHWAKIGIIGNILLTTVKAAAGIFGNSTAMVADAIHSASDILASAAVFVSLRIAKQPADKSHPYGHGKAEALCTFIVGMLLVLAGLQIFRSGFLSIRRGGIETPGIIALYAAILSITTKEIMYRLTMQVGKRINSPSTMANALDHRSDAFSSIATLIGISGARLGFPVLDPIAGMVVSLFILKMGIDIIKDGTRQIMDSSVSEDWVGDIHTIASSVRGVKDAHWIRTRQSGMHYLVDLDIIVDKDLALADAHAIADQVRDRIMSELDKIYEVRVHVDPDQ